MDNDASQEPVDKEMGFFDHLEELRWRLVKSVIAVLCGAILCAVFSDEIVNQILLAPAAHTTPPFKLQNLQPFGQLNLYMQVIIICGIILAMPVVVYQFWRFLAPGLKLKERNVIRWASFFTIFCFLCGMVFAYFVMMPMSLAFMASFGSPQIENNIAVNEYLSFFVFSAGISGIVFELPVVAYFLSRIGFLTPAFMRHYRRHSFVVILIVAAILSPGTDPIAQITLAIPLLLLFEISIGVSAWVERGKKKKEMAENAS